MTVREIPRSFEYICDSCGEIHVQEGAAGHYTQSTPDTWMSVRAFSSSFSLNVNGNYWRDKLYCAQCAKPIIKLLERSMLPTTFGERPDARSAE